jgi:hypothetical protein
MSGPRFPAGWDAEQVRRLVEHYEEMTEDELVAEDEAAVAKRAGQTVIMVPDDLLPAIRRLLASHKTG